MVWSSIEIIQGIVHILYQQLFVHYRLLFSFWKGIFSIKTPQVLQTDIEWTRFLRMENCTQDVTEHFWLQDQLRPGHYLTLTYWNKTIRIRGLVQPKLQDPGVNSRMSVPNTREVSARRSVMIVAKEKGFANIGRWYLRSVYWSTKQRTWLSRNVCIIK